MTTIFLIDVPCLPLQSADLRYKNKTCKGKLLCFLLSIQQFYQFFIPKPIVNHIKIMIDNFILSSYTKRKEKKGA